MAVISSTSASGCRTVCVTGAGGFVASWIVKLLLEKGYFIKGTVRNPDKNNRSPGCCNRSPPPLSQFWCPPQPGWIKLNVDGASRGNSGLAGGGGVMRLVNGSCLLSFSAFFGDCSALRAELLAIKMGLHIMQARCVRLILESDSQEAIDLISTDLPTSHADYYIIKDCKDLLKHGSWNIRLSKINWGTNRVADTLAILAFFHLSNLVVYDSPPVPILDPLEKDMYASFA